jgi:hypothetical protein
MKHMVGVDRVHRFGIAIQNVPDQTAGLHALVTGIAADRAARSRLHSPFT